ncbi:hypothetical protein M9H77_17412 [Catharanthus roseus]|uniref:Uncharacterized protein n=1 Tax=Catharanthus roseus TaxID=4058 RepID=A0ACC0B4I6_CATRO|nr:hypothetical protein M9H77_17412 [Catharanthus roseus]
MRVRRKIGSSSNGVRRTTLQQRKSSSCFRETSRKQSHYLSGTILLCTFKHNVQESNWSTAHEPMSMGIPNPFTFINSTNPLPLPLSIEMS